MQAIETTQTPEQAMARLILSFWLSQAVYVTAKLGVADLLSDGPKDSETLAKEAGANTDRLHRLLRFLTGQGVFAEVEPGRFALTPLGDCLRTHVPNSLRRYAELYGEPWWQRACDLLHSVVTGEPGFERVHGMSVFQFMAENPASAATFNAAMSDGMRQRQIAMAAHDFAGFHTVIDVAGGRGTLLAAILQAHPHLRGILFDVPHVVEEARQHLQTAGVSERCKAIGGDFFQEVPAGGDAYVLSSVIHDWDDEHAVQILQSVRRVIAKGGTLLLVEQVIPDNNEPSLGAFADLTMMVVPGGRERTEAEFRALLASASFELQSVTNSGSLYSLIEATPV